MNTTFFASRRFLVALAATAMIATPVAARTPDYESYIPEDSPYVIALTEPMPRDLQAKLEPKIDALLGEYRQILEAVLAEAMADLPEDEGAAATARPLGDLAGEIVGLLSVEGIENAGLKLFGTAALYGYGMSPVLRLELDDAARFEATLDRILAKADMNLQNAAIGGDEYRFADFDAIRLAVAVDADQAVLTVMPASANDEAIAGQLGFDKPRRNIKRARTLRDIRRQYGFEDQFTGYIDTLRLAATFLGDRNPADVALFSAFGLDGESDSDLSPTCKAEFLEIAGISPRMVMGYREISTKVLDSLFVVELREDIADGLATLPAPVAGLGADPGGFFSFGMSLNPLKLRHFIEARVEAMEADPYECEALAGLQDGTAKMREALEKPVPPVAYGFRGFMMNVDDVEGMDLANETPPSSVDGSFLLAIENAEALMTMATMFSPDVAALNLLPDGKPVRIDMPDLHELASDAYAAMTQGALSIAVGEDAEDKARDSLVAATPARSPFMSLSMDAARYYALIGEAMVMEADEDGGKELPPHVRESLRDMMLSVGDLYERFLLDVHFTGNGVELQGKVTLAD